MNFYNENDPRAAAWLRELARTGNIPSSDTFHVDTRSVTELKPNELFHYDQVHLFAGIGGWSLALRLAEWPDDRPVWTGSCPCQPFSVAGQRGGTGDKRHLWPEMLRLISVCQPPVIFGEQVASPLGREWLAGVRTDLEALGYEVGAADLCAAGVGAPHIRQRLYWVADSQHTKRRQVGQHGQDEFHRNDNRWQEAHSEPGTRSEVRGLAFRGLAYSERARPGSIATSGSTGWGNTWLQCLDEKARRVEPGIFPLAHGVPGRVGLLRGYGNAIVPQLAAEFIRACCDVIDTLASSA